jgi:alcohol dehydrogenase class IV
VYAETARAAGLASEGSSDGTAASRLVAATETLMQELGLPTHLSELGVTADALPAMSVDASEDIGARFNLRPGRNPKELEELYRSAL